MVHETLSWSRKGQGLMVRWQSDGRERGYSRLYGGEKGQCVAIDQVRDDQERLWRTEDCEEVKKMRR